MDFKRSIVNSNNTKNLNIPSVLCHLYMTLIMAKQYPLGEVGKKKKAFLTLF